MVEMQLSLNYDLQRQMLVSGPQNPTPFILKAPFLAGDTVSLTVYAQTPTGTPGTPYANVPITALFVSLNYVVGGAYVDLANTDGFALSGGVATGSFTIPQGVTIPATMAYQIASLQAQITTAGGTSPLQSACVLRNPSFPILSPTGPGQYASVTALAAETTRAETAEALISFAPAITSVGDGAPTSLEAVPTAALPTPLLRTIYLPNSDQLQDWLLYPSTATTATAGGIQRPNDFNAATNEKVWFLKRSN